MECLTHPAFIQETKMDTFYIDGKYVDEDKCVLSVKDIIVLRGFGVFDFLITYNKRPFYLREHVQRLENSASKIGLKIKHTNDRSAVLSKKPSAATPITMNPTSVSFTPAVSVRMASHQRETAI